MAPPMNVCPFRKHTRRRPRPSDGSVAVRGGIVPAIAPARAGARLSVLEADGAECQRYVLASLRKTVRHTGRGQRGRVSHTGSKFLRPLPIPGLEIVSLGQTPIFFTDDKSQICRKSVAFSCVTRVRVRRLEAWSQVARKLRAIGLA